VGHGANARNILQQLDVLRPRVEFVIGNHGANGLATKLAVFGRIGQLVETGLDDLRGVFKIRQQVLLGNA